MARIDHNNYEAWLLDRLEGRLTPDQARELEAFLLAHPALRPDDEPLPELPGARDRITTAEKEQLKRALPPTGMVSDATVDDHIVASLEGDLDPNQEKALKAYLSEHPAHARAQRMFTLARVGKEHLVMPEGAGLHRALPPEGLVDARSLADHLVARMEGDLSPAQEQALVAYLAAHTEANREWSLMQAARISAAAIPFPDKAGLKRGGKVVPLFPMRGMVRWAAAASVALLLAAAWWYNRTESLPMAQRVSPSATSGQAKENTQPDAAAQEQVPEIKQPAELTREEGARPSSQGKPSSDRPSQPPVPIRDEEPLEPAPTPVQVQLAQDHGTAPVDPEKGVAPNTERSDALVLAGEKPLPAASIADERTLGQAIAGALRERVLERPAQEKKPLDADDAVAALDRGIRAVGGKDAGLDVQRDAQGRGNGFALRLGRNLAITASR
jgi:hypothetical protein